MAWLFGIVAFVQVVLHYLGWFAVVGGAVAVLFGNWPRGLELLIGGFSLVVLKFLVGLLFVVFCKITGLVKD
jgi:hypothetical protein